MVGMKLAEAVNDLGNALTAARWPEGKRFDGVKYNTSEAFKAVAFASADVSSMETDLKDCVNELCLKCGTYRNAHKGACDSCRWLKVKDGF